MILYFTGASNSEGGASQFFNSARLQTVGIILMDKVIGLLGWLFKVFAENYILPTLGQSTSYRDSCANPRMDAK